MKRKFKLFATVASLCLCLALMAFGVYAASSVTYNATGKVSYSFEGNYVSIAVTSVEQEKQTATDYDSITALTDSEGFVDLNSDHDWDVLNMNSSNYAYGDNDQTFTAANVPTINFNNGYGVKIVLTITRDKDVDAQKTKTSDITATLTSKNENLSVSSVTLSNSSLEGSANSKVTATFFIGLKDNSKEITSVAAGDWTLKLTIANPA